MLSAARSFYDIDRKDAGSLRTKRILQTAPGYHKTIFPFPFALPRKPILQTPETNCIRAKFKGPAICFSQTASPLNSSYEQFTKGYSPTDLLQVLGNSYFLPAVVVFFLRVTTTTAAMTTTTTTTMA